MTTKTKSKKIVKDDIPNMSNNIYAKKYASYDFIPFTINIQTNNDGKKILKNVPSFSKISDENYDEYIDDGMNGMAIRMGEILNIDTDNYYVILIDIDNKQDTNNVLNGLEKWNTLIKKKKINTPTQKTGNNGLHYLFKVSLENFNKLPASITELSIDGQKYSIDFKGKNQFMIVEPSKYDEKHYKWIIDFTTEIQELPVWLFNILINHKSNNVNVKPQSNKTTKKGSELMKLSDCEMLSSINDIDIDIDSVDDDYSTEDIQKLLSLLSITRVDNYDEWIEVGIALYNATKGHGLSYWDEWSKSSAKYKKIECSKKWNSFKNIKTKNQLTMGSIIYWCKLDNPNEYNKYKIKRKNDEMIIRKYPDMNLEIGDTVTVNNKKCTYLNNTKCCFTNKIHKGIENPLYVEIHNEIMEIRCMHRNCIGKTCPYPSIRLTKNEMNLINHGTVNVTINNYNSIESNELMEFPRFDIFEDDHINNLIFNSLNGSHATMADIIYYYYRNIYVYGENNNWYCYKNHKWNLIGNSNHKLSYETEEKLKAIYQEMINYGKEIKLDNSKINELKKIRKSFDTVRMKEDILKVTKERFRVKNNPNNDFVKNLDSNDYLLVFNNGVYDLKTNIFRDGIPDDNMSMSMDYDYINKHSNKNEELLNFLSDIQPNDDERNFLLTYLSHALYGNMLEWFTILTGGGRNGKSKLVELLKKTFGEYYDSVKSQLFTRPQPDAQTPDPGLLSLRKKKLVISSEPEKNAKLNSGFIKFITGRDSTKLRECHSNQMVDFDPKFITLFVCNDIPDTDDIDTAFSKRLRCIHFPTEFCDKPIHDTQRLIDTKINEKFDSWRGDFMLLLIGHYKKYMKNKEIIVTDNILTWTNQYKEATDIYLTFLNECTEESVTHIRTSVLYDGFKTWFITNNPKTRIPSNREFMTNIKKHKTVERIRDNDSVINGIKKLKIIK